MGPSIGIFSRRKNSEDKSLRNLLSGTPSYDSPEPSNQSVSEADGSESIISAPRFITSPHYVSKPVVTGGYGGGSFGLVHAPALTRPRNPTTIPFTSTPHPGTLVQRPESSKSQASSSKGKKVNRSKSESTSKLLRRSKEEKSDSRKSAAPVLATVHSQTPLNNFDSPPMPPRRIQTPTRPPGTPPNRAQDIPVSLSPGVGVLPNDLPEPLRPFSNESSPAGSPRSMSFSLSPYLDGSGNNSSSQLQLTPPISPENNAKTAQVATSTTPYGIFNQSYMDHHLSIANTGTSVAPLNVRKKKTESDLIVEIAALKKSLTMKDDLIQKLDPSFQPDTSTPNTDLQRMNQILLRRIRDLEKSNNEREETLSRHASKFQALRQSHNALVETMRISYEAEIASLKESMISMDKAKRMSMPDNEELSRLRKREKELMRVVRERDEELETMKKDVGELRGKLFHVEKLVAQRDGELEVAEMRARRMSEQTMMAVRPSGLLNREDENEEIVTRLAEETRLREMAEQELDAAVLKHKAELEEALSMEREKAREDQQELLAEEKRKREEYKATTWKEVEEILREEEARREKTVMLVQEELSTRLQQEETRRAELAAGFNSRFSELEQARKTDLDSFEAQLGLRKESEQVLTLQNQELQARVAELQGLLDRDKDAIESLKNSHEDIMRIAKRINERLGEEKLRNKHLEETARSMSGSSTYPHTNSVSIDAHLQEEVMVLKRQLEDRDARVEVLKTELDAWKVEMKTVDEAWRKLDAESKSFQEVLTEKEKRIGEIELEKKGLSDTLEMYRREFDKLKKRASVALDKAIGGDEAGAEADVTIKAEVLRDLVGHTPAEGNAVTDGASQLNLLEQLTEAQSALAEANKEIHLYKLDVRGYRKDVRRRDAQILNLNRKTAELESTLHQKLLDISALQDELQLERRLPQPIAGGSSKKDNVHLLAGKISSVKDENLQLKQRVRIQEDELRQVQEEREGLKKTLQQYTEQQGLVISDLEAKAERFKLEKEQAEKRVRRAMSKVAELKTNQIASSSIALPIPQTLMGELGEGLTFTESVLKAVAPPLRVDLEYNLPSSTSSPGGATTKVKRKNSHSRSHSFGHGRTHSRTSSRDISGHYSTPSPINTSIPPPQFPSPTTPLPPLPPKSPTFPPVTSAPLTSTSANPTTTYTTTTHHPRPGTASSDDDFSPLGLGFHANPLSTPRRKKISSIGTGGEKGLATGKRLSIVLEPPPTPKKESHGSAVAAPTTATSSGFNSGGCVKRGEGKELPRLPEDAIITTGSDHGHHGPPRTAAAAENVGGPTIATGEKRDSNIREKTFTTSGRSTRSVPLSAVVVNTSKFTGGQGGGDLTHQHVANQHISYHPQQQQHQGNHQYSSHHHSHHGHHGREEKDKEKDRREAKEEKYDENEDGCEIVIW